MNQPSQGGQQPRRKNNRRRGNKPKAVDIWHPVPRLPEATPVRPAADPTAMLRSLGDPPLPGQGQVAEHYLAAVVERAAGLSTALAASAGLLDMGDGDED